MRRGGAADPTAEMRSGGGRGSANEAPRLSVRDDADVA